MTLVREEMYPATHVSYGPTHALLTLMAPSQTSAAIYFLACALPVYLNMSCLALHKAMVYLLLALLGNTVLLPLAHYAHSNILSHSN